MKASGAIMAGGRRIKQRRKRSSAPVVNNVHGDYIDSVNELNQRLVSMKDNDYIKFRDFSTRLVEKLGNELKRSYFKNRNEFKTFKGEGDDSSQRLKYLFTNLFKPVDQLKILMNADNIDYISKTFTQQGIYMLTQMVNQLKDCIQERSYNQVDPEKLYNEESFVENCKKLGIENTDDKVPFSLIKEKYEIRKKELADAENTDDLEKSLELSNAFISLRNQYENYLASFSPNEVINELKEESSNED